MSKRRLSIKARIPLYKAPRHQWRKEIHQALIKETKDKGVKYTKTDRLELHVVLYLRDNDLLFNDVDNRLKFILDAFQGRAGGSKTQPTMIPIVPNDRQIFKVTIEKKKPPKQSLGQGHVIVRKYR